MEILGGKAKGVVLKAPPGALVRPTAVRARRALFDSLGDLTGKSVCDLFAGSGALGLESASRGADRILFVEKAAQSLAAIKSNIRKLERHCPDCKFIPFHGSIPESADRIASFPAVDLIFADPPYAESPELLDKLLQSPRFAEWATASVMIWELPEAGFQIRVFPPGWKMQAIRQFGGTRFLFIARGG